MSLTDIVERVIQVNGSFTLQDLYEYGNQNVKNIVKEAEIKAVKEVWDKMSIDDKNNFSKTIEYTHDCEEILFNCEAEQKKLSREKDKIESELERLNITKVRKMKLQKELADLNEMLEQNAKLHLNILKFKKLAKEDKKIYT